MKVTAIPAQITTVEDRIVGNLNPTQLLLLTVPLFLTAAIFFILPPFGHYALYKILIAAFLLSISSLLALRIGDKIALDLLKLRAGFELRPHIYTYQRIQTIPELSIPQKSGPPKQVAHKVNLKDIKTTSDSRLKSQKMMRSHGCAVSFESRSGGLIVKVNVAN